LRDELRRQAEAVEQQLSSRGGGRPGPSWQRLAGHQPRHATLRSLRGDGRTHCRRRYDGKLLGVLGAEVIESMNGTPRNAESLTEANLGGLEKHG